MHLECLQLEVMSASIAVAGKEKNLTWYQI